jgi:hypothetical protein
LGGCPFLLLKTLSSFRRPRDSNTLAKAADVGSAFQDRRKAAANKSTVCILQSKFRKLRNLKLNESLFRRKRAFRKRGRVNRSEPAQKNAAGSRPKTAKYARKGYHAKESDGTRPCLDRRPQQALGDALQYSASTATLANSISDAALPPSGIWGRASSQDPAFCNVVSIGVWHGAISCLLPVPEPRSQ